MTDAEAAIRAELARLQADKQALVLILVNTLRPQANGVSLTPGMLRVAFDRAAGEVEAAGAKALTDRERRAFHGARRTVEEVKCSVLGLPLPKLDDAA